MATNPCFITFEIKNHWMPLMPKCWHKMRKIQTWFAVKFLPINGALMQNFASGLRVLFETQRAPSEWKWAQTSPACCFTPATTSLRTNQWSGKMERYINFRARCAWKQRPTMMHWTTTFRRHVDHVWILRALQTVLGLLRSSIYSVPGLLQEWSRPGLLYSME